MQNFFSSGLKRGNGSDRDVKLRGRFINRVERFEFFGSIVQERGIVDDVAFRLIR